jgi:hypothetical protein
MALLSVRKIECRKSQPIVNPGFTISAREHGKSSGEIQAGRQGAVLPCLFTLSGFFTIDFMYLQSARQGDRVIMGLRAIGSFLPFNKR